MADAIRAIYEHGQLHLLDPVNLTEGQEVKITIVPDADLILAALGDLVTAPDLDDSDIEVEQYADEIENGFAGTRPLSEIIIEERGEQL